MIRREIDGAVLLEGFLGVELTERQAFAISLGNRGQRRLSDSLAHDSTTSSSRRALSAAHSFASTMPTVERLSDSRKEAPAIVIPATDQRTNRTLGIPTRPAKRWLPGRAVTEAPYTPFFASSMLSALHTFSCRSNRGWGRGSRRNHRVTPRLTPTPSQTRSSDQLGLGRPRG